MNNTSSPPPFVPYAPPAQSSLARGLDLAKAGDWTAAERAFTEAIRAIYLWGLGIAVLGFLATLFVPERPLRKAQARVSTASE